MVGYTERKTIKLTRNTARKLDYNKKYRILTAISATLCAMYAIVFNPLWLMILAILFIELILTDHKIIITKVVE